MHSIFVPKGCIGLSTFQREWITYRIGESILTCSFRLCNDGIPIKLRHVTISVDYMLANDNYNTYDIGDMHREFLEQFCGLFLTVGQPLFFKMENRAPLRIKVRKLETENPYKSTLQKYEKIEVNSGLLDQATVCFTQPKWSLRLKLVRKSGNEIIPYENRQSCEDEEKELEELKKKFALV